MAATCLTMGKHFICEFLDGAATLGKGKLPGWGCAVDAQYSPADNMLFGHEQAVHFHSMQGRIEGSWGNFVAVAGELFAHPRAMNRLLCGVVKDVQEHRSTK